MRILILAKRTRAIVLITLAITSITPTRAAESGDPQSNGSEPQFTTRLIRTGLYLISSASANSVVRLSPSGLIIVDGQPPDQFRLLMSQVRRISKVSDLPIRALILTDHHVHHTGTNSQFFAAKIPIIAHENAKRNLSTCTACGTDIALPIITYEQDYKLRLAGVEVELMHFGSGHTSGDTVVYFPGLKVIAVGDLFSSNGPELNFGAGGSLVDWGRVLAQILKLDFDIVVPGKGPIVSRAELEEFKLKLDVLISRALALVESGVAKDELLPRLGTDDLGWRLQIERDELASFYADLSGMR